MKRFVLSALKCVAVAAAAGYPLLGGVAAWAQGSSGSGSGGSTTSSSGASPFVLPYALLLLCVFLGVFLVVRPTKRRDRPKT